MMIPTKALSFRLNDLIILSNHQQTVLSAKCGNHIEKYIELGVKWCQFLSELGEILKNNSQYLASTNLV